MWGDSFQRSSSIHHVNCLDSLEGKEQEKLIQPGRRLRKGGLTKRWQLFKFKALSGEYNFLSVAWDPA